MITISRLRWYGYERTNRGIKDFLSSNTTIHHTRAHFRPRLFTVQDIICVYVLYIYIFLSWNSAL
jgi:hypothetical protein